MSVTGNLDPVLLLIFLLGLDRQVESEFLDPV